MANITLDGGRLVSSLRQHFIRTFVSHRESELYKLRRRTELVSSVVDQHNYLPIRPLDSDERPGWSTPALKIKETVCRMKSFSIAQQYSPILTNSIFYLGTVSLNRTGNRHFKPITTNQKQWKSCLECIKIIVIQ